MTTTQKIIKYFAIAFALFLLLSIFSGIVGAVSGLSNLFGQGDAVGEMQSYAITGDVEDLEIDLSGAQLEIRTGDAFSVQSNHNYLQLENRDGLLTIKEDHPVFGSHNGGLRTILTVPEGFVFDRAEIGTGAGAVQIDTLQAERLSLDIAVGEVKINQLVANTEAKINGGIGELHINGGELANLDFDMGVGQVNLASRLTGRCDIDCGAGELNLTLAGTPKDYCISLDKGVGEATLDGMRMHDEQTYGSGDTEIEIDGGVGQLHVFFDKELPHFGE